jgi:hypothetical protein
VDLRGPNNAPNRQKEATRKVLEQAEALCAVWEA